MSMFKGSYPNFQFLGLINAFNELKLCNQQISFSFSFLSQLTQIKDYFFSHNYLFKFRLCFHQKTND